MHVRKVDEENVTNCICSYYRSVEVSESSSPCVNINCSWTASPSIHSGAFTMILLSSPFRRGASHCFTCPWLLSGLERLSAKLGRHSWNSFETWFYKECLLFSVTSHTVLFFLHLPWHITLPLFSCCLLFSLIHSYMPVNVICRPNYWLFIKEPAGFPRLSHNQQGCM